MAFNLALIAKIDAGYNTKIPALFMHDADEIDNKATVAASGYFNAFASSLTHGDTIISHDSDGQQILAVDAVSPNVTTVLVAATV